MPAFKYEALDANGKSSNGIVEAESAKAARTHLRGLQLVPLGLTPVAVVESAEKRSLFARIECMPLATAALTSSCSAARPWISDCTVSSTTISS